ncbi:uncharacterized protein EURHEDRAFT_552159, partial [Aspergillus ruber CBS 135680]
ISDFGGAFFKNEPPKEVHTSTLLLPSVYIFYKPINQAVDVWTLGHLLYETFGQSRFFGGFYPDQNDTVNEMISTLGPLPDHW